MGNLVSIDAERLLIGSILNDNSNIYKIIKNGLLPSDDAISNKILAQV